MREKSRSSFWERRSKFPRKTVGAGIKRALLKGGTWIKIDLHTKSRMKRANDAVRLYRLFFRLNRSLHAWGPSTPVGEIA
ncbi:hypothetical protein CLOSTMETH_00338 [[Clostridium] methylpentosum DSM 5476]|uniref:Uncharacterized protein n=1 Tax=[Clostridium] methylpentosum DSM 5476 TaxID=537013 RepID=C0E943_9FIRM|nr:hypothetical protein CLOSTMETH_00338 [[Clostridium] methylpentosum DSM 5476]